MAARITAVDFTESAVAPGVVTAVCTLGDGTGPTATLGLFTFYRDELAFTADELVGLTEAEAHQLRHDKDVRYLQS